MKKFLLKALGLGIVATAAVAAYAIIKDYMTDSACNDYNDDFEDDLQECCLTKDTCDCKEDNCADSEDKKPCECENKEETEAVKEDASETSEETKEDAPTSETAE